MPAHHAAVQASYQQLAFKLNSLFRDCLTVYTFPELQKRLSRFEQATTNAAAALLLKRGRK
jgi:hypothetical protein